MSNPQNNPQQVSQLYLKFEQLVNEGKVEDIKIEALKLLRQKNVLVSDVIAVVEAYKYKGSDNKKMFIMINLYLQSGWWIEISITQDGKAYQHVHYGNGAT